VAFFLGESCCDAVDRKLPAATGSGRLILTSSGARWLCGFGDTLHAYPEVTAM
jgi:hypothetical protein